MKASSLAFSEIFFGVTNPETTSSPCDSIKYSPLILSSPVSGFLEKITPEALLSFKFPKTILCIVTARPILSGISFIFRYEIALSLSHEFKTAIMDLFI